VADASDASDLADVFSVDGDNHERQWFCKGVASKGRQGMLSGKESLIM
jgi:hypothetical protein